MSEVGVGCSIEGVQRRGIEVRRRCGCCRVVGLGSRWQVAA